LIVKSSVVLLLLFITWNSDQFIPVNVLDGVIFKREDGELYIPSPSTRQNSHNSSTDIVAVTNIVWDFFAMSSTGNAIGSATDDLDSASLFDFYNRHLVLALS
jgi:hypothetical protein